MHEMSKPIFWKKKRRKMSSAEFLPSMLSVKKLEVVYVYVVIFGNLQFDEGMCYFLMHSQEFINYSLVILSVLMNSKDNLHKWTLPPPLVWWY